MRRYSKIDITMVVFLLIGVICAIYCSGWLLFASPIFKACALLETGTLTASAVVVTIIKCLLATPVASIIIYVASVLGMLVSEIID